MLFVVVFIATDYIRIFLHMILNDFEYVPLYVKAFLKEALIFFDLTSKRSFHSEMHNIFKK